MSPEEKTINDAKITKTEMEENDYEFTTEYDKDGNNSYTYSKGDQSKVDTSCYDKKREDIKFVEKI